MRIYTTLITCFFIWQFVAQSYQSGAQLLWEISLGNKKSYVWGTLHSNDKRVFDFPDSVYVLLKRSSLVALETDFFKKYKQQDVRLEEQILTLDKRGKMYTSSSRPTKTLFGSEDGTPQFMDAWFQAKASLQETPIIGLLDENFGDLEGNTELFSGERNAIFGRNESAILSDFYLQGNLKKIEAILSRNLVSSSQQEEILAKKEALISTLRSTVEQGNVFFVLGIELLLGEEGVLEKLKSLGIKMRPIQCSYSSNPTTDELTINALNHYELLREVNQGGLKARFPGKPLETEGNRNELDFEFKELGQGNTFRIEVLERDTSLSLTQYAAIYIASPPYSPFFLGTMEDGTEYAQGLSDSYPDGLKWVRVIFSESNVAVISCNGGNKFMNSDRPTRFFNQVVLE